MELKRINDGEIICLCWTGKVPEVTFLPGFVLKNLETWNIHRGLSLRALWLHQPEHSGLWTQNSLQECLQELVLSVIFACSIIAQLAVRAWKLFVGVFQTKL